MYIKRDFKGCTADIGLESNNGADLSAQFLFINLLEK